MEETRQHALDRALREIVGGRTPTDQTFRILSAVQRARQATAPAKGRRPRQVAWALGAVLGAAAGLLLWSATGREDASRPVLPELQVRVLEGTLEWQALSTTYTGASGDSFAVIPRIGDHLASAPFRQTRARVGELGTLIMTPGTQLEIEDMKWQQFGIGFGSGSLTVAVLVGSFTWLAGDDSIEAAPGDRIDLERPVSRAQIGDLQAHQLEQDLAAARAEIEQLRAVAQRQAVEPEPVAEEELVPEPEFHPLDLDPELDALFATLDWRTLSAQSIELNGTLQRLMTLLAAGEDIPSELVGELERLKGTLHAQGGFLDEGLIPGTNFDTQARHPLVGAQWLSAVLEYSSLPLDDHQRLALTDLARRYAAEDEARRAGYGDDTSLIRKYVDELELQDRFYRDAGFVMNDAQKQLFSVGDFEGRVGAKLVGTASMAWGEWTQPVVVRTREEFAAAMTTGFANALGLEGSQHQALQSIASEWGKAFPAEWWDRPYDDLDRYGGYDVDRLRVAARVQLQFFDRVINTLGLTAEQRQILRQVRSLVVPYRRK